MLVEGLRGERDSGNAERKSINAEGTSTNAASDVSTEQAGVSIGPASRSQAAGIAQLIMQAMNYDCCQYFVGEGYTLADFEAAMTDLVAQDNSQYSYRNTLVATAADGTLCGIIVAYDGALLHTLRRAFVDIMWQRFRRDFSNMQDETQAGELYLDSLAVRADCRGKGIATMLLTAAINRGRDEGLPAVGLLVDCGNPRAEALYCRLGFECVGNSTWGGHPMHHLQYKLR